MRPIGPRDAAPFSLPNQSHAMKTLVIKDLDAAKELSRDERAAVRGGIAAGGCFPTEPAPGMPSYDLDPQAMMDAILAQVPPMPSMPSYPTLPGQEPVFRIQPVAA